ncbi:winged helix-turn-helix domain-containing protein [Glycomyces albidus]|uniref:GntR family transcriptional regulator n=1 Tax=Glycomyces albidus TaxID=2656774 RepID=A0A6L5GAR6_9ACTN|nr:winged helix-turn-helix domain-containing protein [Glycomyces albidus]MQM26643.1 GntR family transcriptional regulator [Glycomyces albidus]
MEDYTDEYDYLGKLDPDSTDSSSVQIANRIKAAILTGKFAPGETLPSNQKLQQRFGVARETVKSAFKILTDKEKLVVTQQGRLPRVRVKTHRSVELRPHVEALFKDDHVAIDFAGFSGETLKGVVSEPLDRIRLGELTPQDVKLRVMVSDMRMPMALPTPVDPSYDAEAVTSRMARITDRALESIVNDVHELEELGLINTGSVEVRMHGIAPVFKLFILNDSEVFFGFYPIVQHAVPINGDRVEIFDPMGKDASLFHFSSTGEESEQGSMFVDSARAWFDSVWVNVATPRSLG